MNTYEFTIDLPIDVLAVSDIIAYCDDKTRDNCIHFTINGWKLFCSHLEIFYGVKTIILTIDRSTGYVIEHKFKLYSISEWFEFDNFNNKDGLK